MPIKPDNRHRYPPDWQERRSAVLERAVNRCELCGAPNGHEIYRMVECEAIWRLHYYPFSAEDWRGPIKVVLTIAHLDPTYQSHELKHLLALCQRCHLLIDQHVRDKETPVAKPLLYIVR